VNLKEIKEMLNLMNENGLVELEIEKDGTRIRLKKAGSRSEGVNQPIVIEREKVSPEISAEAFKSAEPKASSKIVEIRAPMVGTFYRAPSPESPPFVEAGQTIEPGQIICIIEAMKLMNEIKCEIRGKIMEILVENAEPVEYGQPLFIVEPS
jgi:acetyl-CoA carboxylase biotin carboxyl carrier protein